MLQMCYYLLQKGNKRKVHPIRSRKLWKQTAWLWCSLWQNEKGMGRIFTHMQGKATFYRSNCSEAIYRIYVLYRNRYQRCSIKKVFLKIPQNRRKTPVPESFSNKVAETCKFIKKETLAQIFSSKLCKIFKSTFFTEHLRQLLSLVLGAIVRKFSTTLFVSPDHTHFIISFVFLQFKAFAKIIGAVSRKCFIEKVILKFS